MLKGNTEACCQDDVECTDLMNFAQKLERFEKKANCERLAAEASRVGGTGILGQCTPKVTTLVNSLKSPQAGRLLGDIKLFQQARGDSPGIPPKTSFLVKIPAHRAGDCAEGRMVKEVRYSDCLGPDCRCPPYEVDKEECHLGQGESACDCEAQCRDQDKVQEILNTQRYDVSGDDMCTCKEFAQLCDDQDIPQRPLAAYKGVTCPAARMDHIPERPPMDPPNPQQQFQNQENPLSRIPAPSCPCSEVQPAPQKEVASGTEKFVEKWAMYESGAAFQNEKET